MKTFFPTVIIMVLIGLVLFMPRTEAELLSALHHFTLPLVY